MAEMKVITLRMPLTLGTVNCFLLQEGQGFVLIDSGSPNARDELEQGLAQAGCTPGKLTLIVLTHGDFDHTGNAAYLREKYGAKIAMREEDIGMTERGDMFWNRSSGNPIMGSLAPILFRFGKANRFTPDLLIGEGDDLSAYGLDARVLSLPGHSKGSIGLLTATGDLFCGDLLENTKRPARNSIMDDTTACEASIERLDALSIGTVYPGHGEPFPMARFSSSARGRGQI